MNYSQIAGFGLAPDRYEHQGNQGWQINDRLNAATTARTCRTGPTKCQVSSLHHVDPAAPDHLVPPHDWSYWHLRL